MGPIAVHLTPWSSNSRYVVVSSRSVQNKINCCMCLFDELLFCVSMYAPGSDGIGKRSEWCSSMPSGSVCATVCLPECCMPCATRHMPLSQGSMPRKRKDKPLTIKGWHMPYCCMYAAVGLALAASSSCKPLL